MNKFFTLSLLRTISVVFLLAGAVGSLALTLLAGQQNNSFILVGLFVCWVLSPYFALLVATIVYKNKPALTQSTINYLMLFLSIVSLVSYSGVLSFPGMKPAFIFLIVPLISWLLLVTVIPIVLSKSRKSSKTDLL